MGLERRYVTTVSVSFSNQLTCAVQCECFYSYRMKLPCRHAVALCLYLDRLLSEDLSSRLSRIGFDSALEYLIRRECSPRRINPCMDVNGTARDDTKDTAPVSIYWTNASSPRQGRSSVCPNVKRMALTYWAVAVERSRAH